MSEREEPGGRESVRTFVCIDLPESIKERIRTLQDELRSLDAQVSWTKPSNIHLTIRFLGNIFQSRVGAVSAAVRSAAASTNPFEVAVGGTGCFPSPRSPRVLWVGIPVIPEGLTVLHRAIEAELAQAGFAREPKKFSPHFTIGRVRSPKNAAQIAERLTTLGFITERFRATKVIVMRSDLNPTGSLYTPQAVITLGRPDEAA